MTSEIWVPVKGFEERYSISNQARIKSLIKKPIIMKPPVNQYGYEYVSLWKNGKRKNIQIHRLVAIAFLDNPENKPMVNHIDGNKRNNHVSNLEWCTRQENTDHAVKFGLMARGERIAQSKLKSFQVKEIIEKYKSGSVTYFELAKQYNVSFSLIGQIVRGKIWNNAV
jgi:hypothetical protein